VTDKIRAPWTPEQVAALNRFQAEGGMHPFTCGKDHATDALHLVAHEDGWHCWLPDCDYRQDWAHAFMADPGAWPKPLEELRQAATEATDWYDAGCARDCSEQHTYEWGRCTMAPESARPVPTIGILWVEGGDGLAKDIVSRRIPLTAWEALITVAKWVSRGRSFAFDADPGIAPCYPDGEARHALGALDDAGLLDRPGDDHAYARMVNRPLSPRETAALRARLESGDYPRRKVRPRTAPEATELPSLDGGPDVADCAAADRNWDVERHGE
jgi:hypothetical protein